MSKEGKQEQMKALKKNIGKRKGKIKGRCEEIKENGKRKTK